MAYGDPNPYGEPIDDETREIIAFYADEMGIPESRFGILDGRLMYFTDGGGYEVVDENLWLERNQTVDTVANGDIPTDSPLPVYSGAVPLGPNAPQGGIADPAAGSPSVHELPDLSKGTKGTLTAGLGSMSPALGTLGAIGAGVFGLADTLGQDFGVVGGPPNPQIGSPEFASVVSMGDIAAGRNRDAGGGRGGVSQDGGGGRGSQGHDPAGHDHGGGLEGPGGFHQGGMVTDYNPTTYQDNMPATVQEGEFVFSRDAVESLGKDFLERLNERAGGRVGMMALRRL